MKRCGRNGLFFAICVFLFAVPSPNASGQDAGGDASSLVSGKTRPSAPSLTAGVNTNGVRVTFVGNAGFLVAVGNKKILIDALFSGFEGDYVLPREIQDKLEFSRPPFDGIDLVLVTHRHGDHFDQGLVGRFLCNNPGAVFASTPQVTALLPDLPGRVITFSPAKNRPVRKDIRGVQVEAIYLSHGAPAAGKTEILNFSYLVTVNGITFFHTGDVDTAQFSFDEFRALQLPEKKIDLGFIQHFYLTDAPAECKFIQEGIAARYIIPMHYHYTVPPMNPESILKNYPDAILFKAELENWVMPLALKKMMDVILPPVSPLAGIGFQDGIAETENDFQSLARSTDVSLSLWKNCTPAWQIGRGGYTITRTRIGKRCLTNKKRSVT